MTATMTPIIVHFFLLLLIYIFKKFLEWRKHASIINRIPGPKAYPIIGNLLDFKKMMSKNQSSVNTCIGDYLDFHNHLHEKYGSITRLWWSVQPIVDISSAEQFQILLSSEVSTSKAIVYKIAKKWLGDSLQSSSGKTWHEKRKFLGPIFHYSILNSSLPVIADNCKVLFDRLHSDTYGQDIDLYPLIRDYTLDTFLNTSMGLKLDIQKGGGFEYVTALNKTTAILLERFSKPWHWIDFLYYSFTKNGKEEKKLIDILHRVSNNAIEKRLIERHTNKSYSKINEKDDIGQKIRKPFLDLVLDAHEAGNAAWTLKDVREAVDIFLIGGMDPAAFTMTVMAYYLAHYPAVQNKVAAELHSVFGDTDRFPTHSDLNKLKYLHCVMCECLRLYSPAPFNVRTLEEDLVMDNKYVISKGTIVQLNFRRLHRDPRFFPNPDKFNPDNFLPENCINRHSYAFIPFSAGIRNCVGQKYGMILIKATISSFLRKYQILPSKKTEKLDVIFEGSLRIKNDMNVQLKPRIWSTCIGDEQ